MKNYRFVSQGTVEVTQTLPEFSESSNDSLVMESGGSGSMWAVTPSEAFSETMQGDTEAVEVRRGGLLWSAGGSFKDRSNDNGTLCQRRAVMPAPSLCRRVRLWTKTICYQRDVTHDHAGRLKRRLIKRSSHHTDVADVEKCPSWGEPA